MTQHEPRRRMALDWSLAWSANSEGPWSDSVPATVPGNAQWDWARATGVEDIHFANHWRRLAGWEDRWWRYAATVTRGQLGDWAGTRAVLVLEGVDYACDVTVADVLAGSRNGMHAPLEIDLTPFFAAGQDSVSVCVHVRPAPKASAEGAWGHEWAVAQRSQARHCTKPSVSYGDDFHPRVIPQGLWQDAEVELRPRQAIESHLVAYELNAGLTAAEVSVQAALSADVAPSSRLRLTIRSADGAEVASFDAAAAAGPMTLTGMLDRPQLWWPRGHGEPYLYRYAIDLLGPDGALLDRREGRLGIRRIELVMHEGAWDYPTPGVWPKGRSNPPMSLKVNGRRIFVRGGCCVPMEIFFGRVTRDDCFTLVRLAAEANFNMLRNSGGCVSLKPAFYDACDEIGLLVWQDFPLSCNLYPEDSAYLELLEREARAMVRKLRTHPSLAIWCGGNELFEYHSGMTDQAPALRLLNSVTFELDRGRPFLPSTPLMGMAHGPYEFTSANQGADGEAISIIQDAVATAYPEFGCAGLASVAQLRSFIPEDELFPPRPGTAWEDHKAFYAFDGILPSWLNLEALERYFGPAETLEQLVGQGQLLQGEALRGMFEETRRQQPMCALAVMWSFNESWPNACSLSILEWPDRPKPSYFKVKDACRATLASARVRRVGWQAGETMSVELWMLSDHPQPVAGGTMEVTLTGPDGIARPVAAWTFDDIPAQANVAGPKVAVVVPDAPGQTFSLALQVKGAPQFDSTYQFVVFPEQRPA